MFAVSTFAVKVDSPVESSLSVLSQQLSSASLLPVQLLERVDSTNQNLLNSAAELPVHPQAPCALMVLQQTAGRGRRGRTWSVAQGPAPNMTTQAYPAFLASLGIRCTMPIQSLSLLPLHIGIAVVHTLNQWGCAAKVKWPNDIVITDPQGMAKLGGILVETRSLSEGEGERAVVMGMGLNWHSAPTLADKLTACVMQHLSQTAPEPLEASAALLGAMAKAWQRCAEPQNDAATANFSDVFAQHDALYGHEVTAFGADGELQHGIAKGINAQGYLGMQLATGQIVWLHSGEVSVRPKAKLVEGAR